MTQALYAHMSNKKKINNKNKWNLKKKKERVVKEDLSDGCSQ
jgi:hypothetical protein